MDDSVALAFYAKHYEILDKIEDCKTADQFRETAQKLQLPLSLVRFTNGQWQTVRTIWNAIKEDQKIFAARVLGELQKMLPSSLQTEIKYPGNYPFEGEVEFAIRPYRGGKVQPRIGFYVSDSDGRLGMSSYVWVSESRLAENELCALVKPWVTDGQLKPWVTDGQLVTASESGEDITRGTVLLGKDEYVQRSKGNTAYLKADQMVEALIKRFAWITEPRMKKICALWVDLAGRR